MIKIKNDFFNRFKSAGVQCDLESQRQIMMSAIARTIINDRSEVMDLLILRGVKLPRNASNKEIAGAIAKYVGGDEKMQDGLAYLVSKNNGVLPPTSSADAGDVAGNAAGLVTGPFAGIIGSLAAATGSIFQSKSEKIKAKSVEDSNRMALVQELIRQDGASATSGVWYVLGAVAALGLVFVVIRVAKK